MAGVWCKIRAIMREDAEKVGRGPVVIGGSKMQEEEPDCLSSSLATS